LSRLKAARASKLRNHFSSFAEFRFIYKTKVR
jgi:hypothetical protein